MMDKIIYTQKQKAEQDIYEAQCKRCGTCCGAQGEDACALLKIDQNGKYYCQNYHSRIGLQKTISGKEFHCVLIRNLGPDLPFANCAYYKHG